MPGWFNADFATTPEPGDSLSSVLLCHMDCIPEGFCSEGSLLLTPGPLTLPPDHCFPTKDEAEGLQRAAATQE